MVINEETTGEFKAVPGKVPVYFTPRTLLTSVGVLAAIWAVITFVLALMFYPREEGNALRSDFDHHCEEVEKVDNKQDAKIIALDNEDRATQKVLHRIELKVERGMSRNQRNALPANLRAPMPDIGDGHE